MSFATTAPAMMAAAAADMVAIGLAITTANAPAAASATGAPTIAADAACAEIEALFHTHADTGSSALRPRHPMTSLCRPGPPGRVHPLPSRPQPIRHCQPPPQDLLNTVNGSTKALLSHPLIDKPIHPPAARKQPPHHHGARQ